MMFSRPVLHRRSNNNFNTRGPLCWHERDLESNCKPHLYISLVLCLWGASSRAITCHLQHPHSFFNEKIAAERNRYNMMETLSKARCRLYRFCTSKTMQAAFSIFLKTVSIFSVLGIYKHQSLSVIILSQYIWINKFPQWLLKCYTLALPLQGILFWRSSLCCAIWRVLWLAR